MNVLAYSSTALPSSVEESLVVEIQLQHLVVLTRGVGALVPQQINYQNAKYMRSLL